MKYNINFTKWKIATKKIFREQIFYTHSLICMILTTKNIE